MIHPVDLEQTAIINHNFIQRLKKDIQKYDILYICAPLGWSKDSIVSEFYNTCNMKNLFLLEETEALPLEQQIEGLPKTGKRILVIPKLEKIIEQGKQELIWKLLEEKKRGDVFLFASSMSIPEKLLPYTLLNRFISYSIDAIRPTNEDVSAYMKSRDVLLTQEELLRIEKDSNNLPLFIQMLGNLMCSTGRGYHRRIKEQCFEDVFTYIDVVFFRTFTKEDQNALLKLSCFEELDNELISYMLDFSSKQTDAFIERLLNKSSVIRKNKNGWIFQTLFKQFLERAIQKYIDYEERMADYERAMEYLISQEKWFFALRFAYILRQKEKIAFCLSKFLSKNIDYNIFVTLEPYFGELTQDSLWEYPELLISGSILKAITGEPEEALWYERQFLQCMNHTENKQQRRKMQAQLLNMYMTRPGMIRENVLEECAALLGTLKEYARKSGAKHFSPHYISILRGEKDYCHYFVPNQDKNRTLEILRDIVEQLGDRSYSLMLMFMEAEVLYERNDLERALNGLAKVTREAKISGNDRIHQLCLLGMVDLMASRNQLNSMETFQMERIEANEDEDSLFAMNSQAHMVYYHLLKNNQEPVLYWLKEQSPDETERFYAIQYYQYFMKAKVYIWMEQYVRARMILQTLLDYAVEYKMHYLEAQVRILKAVVYFRESDGKWKKILTPAVEWGKELEFVRIFADEGAAVYEMLNRLATEEKTWANDEYFKKVLSATKAQMLQYPKYLKQEKQGDIGEFSESEQAVMRLLVHGDKNADIANQLCVSENTVKYHLKNIYQKLQVKSRSQAISKIREYELL